MTNPLDNWEEDFDKKFGRTCAQEVHCENLFCSKHFGNIEALKEFISLLLQVQKEKDVETLISRIEKLFVFGISTPKRVVEDFVKRQEVISAIKEILNQNNDE